MNANQFLDKLRAECFKHADMCGESCPFYSNEYKNLYCTIASVTGDPPFNVAKVKIPEEPVKVNTPDEFPKVEIYASVNFYNQKVQADDEC